MNINTHINTYAKNKSIKHEENCHSDILNFRHIPSLFKISKSKFNDQNPITKKRYSPLQVVRRNGGSILFVI